MRPVCRISVRPSVQRCAPVAPSQPFHGLLTGSLAPQVSARPMQMAQVFPVLRFSPVQRLHFPILQRQYSTAPKAKEEEEEVDDAEDATDASTADPAVLAAQRAARKDLKKNKTQLLKDQRKAMIERSKLQKQKQQERKAKMNAQPGKVKQQPKKARLDDFEDMED